MSIDFENELRQIGWYPTVLINGAPSQPVPMLNTPITPKENYLRFLRRDHPLWTPCGMDIVTLIPMINPDNPARGLVFDNCDFKEEDSGGPDMFGVEWEYVPQVHGSMVRPGNPLKIPDITRWEEYLTFPDLDGWDWKGWGEKNRALAEDGRVKEIWIMNGLFERLISFMEFENAALALVDEEQQEGVHRLMSALCDFYDELIDRFHTYYGATSVYFHDDWGSQRAPFFSADTCWEMIGQYLKRVCDSCHKRDMALELHSCGKIETLVPVMIAAGVDLWGGQPMNDYDMLVDKYGDQMCFSMFVFPMKPEPTWPDFLEAIDRLFARFGERVKTGMVLNATNDTNAELFKEIYRRTRREPV